MKPLHCITSLDFKDWKASQKSKVNYTDYVIDKYPIKFEQYNKACIQVERMMNIERARQEM